jgi:hypothetical protein
MCPWPQGNLKADSHIACRSHAVLQPCRAAKGLECVFPVWFTQCGHVWFIKMWSVNQTRPHCVNQTGKTHSKFLAARHGRGTAWARHAMCESALTCIGSCHLWYFFPLKCQDTITDTCTTCLAYHFSWAILLGGVSQRMVEEGVDWMWSDRLPNNDHIKYTPHIYCIWYSIEHLPLRGITVEFSYRPPAN